MVNDNNNKTKDQILENINTNSQKVDQKKMLVASELTFCGLPTEDTSFVIEANENNKLKSCKKLEVCYTRVNMESIYGSPSKKIPRDADAIKNVEKYLREFHASSIDESKDSRESFDDWRNRYCLTKTQLVTTQRARIDALRLENTDVEKHVANMTTLLDADKLDLDAMMELQAKIAEKIAAAQAIART